MIDAKALSDSLSRFIGREVAAVPSADRISVLTPAEYPNGDGVVVWVEATDGSYRVSDDGEADATLIGRVGSRAIAAPAMSIARRFGAKFDGGRVIAPASESSLPETCWRVAQAAAAIAEATTFHKAQTPRDPEFVDLLAREFRRRQLEIERNHSLVGASGHPHQPSIYLPATETVVEPVGGDRAWNVASAVYVEFGDLRSANGFKLLAVLDDRESDIGEDVAALLRQVANVTRWSRHEEWLASVGRGDLIF